MRRPYRPIGILEHWNTGILGYWNVGQLEYWDFELLEYWDTGNIGTHSIVMRKTELDRVMPWRERVQ